MPAKKKLRPLWRCPNCGAQFLTPNILHSCGRFSLTKLFARSEPGVLPLFKQFAALVRRCGRVTLIPQKTRAAFLARTRFVSVQPRKDGFLAGFIIGRPLVHPRVVKHEFYPPHVHLNYVRVTRAADLDAELFGWLRDSYRYYGQQGHLAARRARSSD